MRNASRDLSEVLGAIAIVLGTAGGIFQLVKSHNSGETTSFSPTYLICATVSELLFAAQGGMKRSATLVITRIGAFAYFAILLALYVSHRMERTTASTSPPRPPTTDSASPAASRPDESCTSDRGRT